MEYLPHPNTDVAILFEVLRDSGSIGVASPVFIRKREESILLSIIINNNYAVDHPWQARVHDLQCCQYTNVKLH